MSDAYARACAAAAEGDRAGVVDALSRRSPESERDCLRWIYLLVEVGALDRAAELTTRLSTPEHVEAVRELVQEALESSSVQGSPPDENVDDGAIREEPQRPGTGESSTRATNLEEDDWRADIPSRDTSADGDAKAVELFLKWFGGRRDLYARQWYSEARARGGYRPVREPLTEAVARAHLSGRTTIGQYLLDGRGKAVFGVIDLDVNANALADLEPRPTGQVDPLDYGPLVQYLHALRTAGRRLGIPLFPAASGGKGAHLWMFFTTPRPASSARSILQQVVSVAGPPPSSVEVEVFPKQDLPGPRGLSSLVKLPLGRHQRTLAFCPLLDDALRPIEDRCAALQRIQGAPDPLVDALVGRRVVPLPAPEGVPRESLPRLAPDGGPRTLAEALRRIPSGAEEVRAAEAVLDRCAALRYLTEKAYARRRLEPEEARALVYSLGLLGKSPETARRVLLAAGAGLKALEQASRGTPAPVGCRKLKRIVAEAGCTACPTGPEAVPYPTPLHFAVASVQVSPPRHEKYAAYLATDGAFVQSGEEKMLEALDRIERRLSALEQAQKATLSGHDHPASEVRPDSHESGEEGR